MTTRLYLIRHGETEGDGIRRYKGSLDIPLSEKGIRQIRELSSFLSQHSPPDAVYTSPLSRAAGSADLIARPYGLTPVVVPEFRELNFGAWEGLSFPEVKERYPEEFAAWADNPMKQGPVDGETVQDVRDRAVPALKLLLDNHRDRTVAVVAHGAVNRILVCHVLGIPLNNIFRIEQDFGALNIIEFREKYPVIKLLNRSFSA